METLVPIEEKAMVKVWTLLLSKQGIKYDEQALQTLLLCKRQGRDTTTEAAFNVQTWEQAGKLIFESASRGNETAKNIVTASRLVLYTLTLVKAVRNAKTAIEALQVPPTKTSSHCRARGGVVKGLGAASSSQVERMSKKPEGEWLSSEPPIFATLPHHADETLLAPHAPVPCAELLALGAAERREKVFVSWKTVCEVLMVHAVPADRTKKDTCATAAAMPTPPVPPANDCKSVGTVGGEPEEGPWFPDPFDPGGDPDSITEELMPSSTMQPQLEPY